MSMKSLNILMTNLKLDSYSGTETYTRNLALELLRSGHRPFVYSPVLGDIANEIRSHGIPVTDGIDNVTFTPDVIHGHHCPTTITAVTRHPTTPAIFVCHDFVAWHDAPPLVPTIRRYVGVSQTTVDRMIGDGGVPVEKTRVLHNPVDLRRFRATTPPPAEPKRALAFAKGDTYLKALGEACDACGLTLEVVGTSVGRPIGDPESLIPKYDIVFASGMTAMETMACDRAVVVCDARGLAGLCTTATFDAFRYGNFGLRTLTEPLTAEAFVREIAKYDPADVQACRRRIEADADIGTFARRLVELYVEAIDDLRTSPPDVDEVRRALASHAEKWSPSLGDPRWPWMVERQELVGRIESLTSPTEPLEKGEIYGFGLSESRPWYKDARGFSHREDWGRWATSAHPSFRFRAPADRSGDLKVEIELNPFVNKHNTEMKVHVFANQFECHEHLFAFDRPRSNRRHAFTIPEDAIDRDGEISMSFFIDRPVSPAELGISGDRRKLGVGLLSFRVD